MVINNKLILQFGKFVHSSTEGAQTVSLNTSYISSYVVLTNCNYANNADELRVANATIQNVSQFEIKAVYSYGAVTNEFAGVIYWLTIGY